MASDMGFGPSSATGVVAEPLSGSEASPTLSAAAGVAMATAAEPAAGGGGRRWLKIATTNARRMAAQRATGQVRIGLLERFRGLHKGTHPVEKDPGTPAIDDPVIKGKHKGRLSGGQEGSDLFAPDGLFDSGSKTKNDGFVG